MCRLFAYASPRLETVREIVGVEQTRRFESMARLHRDGWGSAWLAGDRARPTMTRKRAATSGHLDPELDRTLMSDEAYARIVHLRLASEGTAKQAENNHPFVADGIAFAHNGAAFPKEHMMQYVRRDIRPTFKGGTDSECYFGVIRSRIADGMGVAEAVCMAVEQLKPMYPHASLNAMVLSATQLIVVSASQGASAPTEEFAGCGIPEPEFPANHGEHYYTLWSKTFDDGTVAFSSSGLDVAGWQEVPAGSVTTVDLRTGLQESVPLRLESAAPTARPQIAPVATATN